MTRWRLWMCRDTHLPARLGTGGWEGRHGSGEHQGGQWSTPGPTGAEGSVYCPSHPLMGNLAQRGKSLPHVTQQ